MRFVKLTFGDPVEMRVRVSLGCHSCSSSGGGEERVGDRRWRQREKGGEWYTFLADAQWSFGFWQWPLLLQRWDRIGVVEGV